MIQKTLNEDNKEMKGAHEFYEKHGFKDGDDFINWLEAERYMSAQPRLRRRKLMQGALLVLVVILCAAVVVLSIMLFRYSSKMELSEKSLSDLKLMMMELSEKNLAVLSDLKVMMFVPDQQADEEVVAFGDTHFGYGKSTLTNAAKTLLDKDIQVLKENPKMKVRMAGYTSAKGTEASNQELSEGRANSVKNYLIEKGIAKERITTIGYGRTRPALYEVSPGAINTKEARANMRVLFEIIVK